MIFKIFFRDFWKYKYWLQNFPKLYHRLRLKWRQDPTAAVGNSTVVQSGGLCNRRMKRAAALCTRAPGCNHRWKFVGLTIGIAVQVAITTVRASIAPVHATRRTTTLQQLHPHHLQLHLHLHHHQGTGTTCPHNTLADLCPYSTRNVVTVF